MQAVAPRGSVDPHVLARARARVLGALSVPVSEPVPPGVASATDGARTWLLSEWPDGATPALLEEYETAAMPLDRAGQARRVLAATLRCCWRRLDDAPWPGTSAAVADVLAVYAEMTHGDSDLARRWATGELRRLSDTGWLLLDEAAGTVRPGPRVALWPDGSLASLRDLLRRLPEPPPAEPAATTPSESSEPPSSVPPPDLDSPLPTNPAASPGQVAEDFEPVDNLAAAPSNPEKPDAVANIGTKSAERGATSPFADPAGSPLADDQSIALDISDTPAEARSSAEFSNTPSDPGSSNADETPASSAENQGE